MLGVQCVEKRVKRRCVKTESIEIDHSEYVKPSENITTASEKFFNLGLALGIQNEPRCVAWKNDPQETAQFVIVNAKDKY